MDESGWVSEWIGGWMSEEVHGGWIRRVDE